MGNNNALRNFLLTLSGIVLLFCLSVPSLSGAIQSVLYSSLRFVGLGWVATMLDISNILFWLAATALIVMGIVFSITDATKEGKQPNWVIVGLAGGAWFLSAIKMFVPFMFWIGFLILPALVVAMYFLYAGNRHIWNNAAVKLASYMLIGWLIVYWDRDFNVIIGLTSINMSTFGLLGGWIAVAAAIYICVWSGKLKVLLDAAGQAGCQMLFIGAILYAVASFLNGIPFLNIVGFLVAIVAWVMALIGYIRLMASKSFGTMGNKPGLVMLIAHCVGILSFLPLFGTLGVVGIGFGWLLAAMGLAKAQLK